MRDYSGAGCARVPITDHCRHDRARVVGLHAHVRSGCGRAASDLDSMAYGQPPAPPPSSVADDAAAARSARCATMRFAQRPYRAVPVPRPCRLCRPMPVLVGRCRCATTAAYRLDAGDKLRVVVYGQEGLTNTYAIDAGGSITMPLIGAVPARGRTPAGLAAAIAASCATAISASLRSRSRSNPTGRSSSSARSRRPASIPTCRT